MDSVVIESILICARGAQEAIPASKGTCKVYCASRAAVGGGARRGVCLYREGGYLQIWAQKGLQLALLAIWLPCWEGASIFTVQWEG